MTKTNSITALIEALTAFDAKPIAIADCCQGGKRRLMEEAKDMVNASDLDAITKQTVCNAITKEANPSGYSYDGSGAEGGIAALEAALIAEQAHGTKEANNGLKVATGFNLRNLQNLVADGGIFHVEFIKRTTGELRKMQCRLGVKKHLKGGSKAYDSSAKNLLTVFDMQAKAYRSIPLEAIQRLTVGGQTFNFVGA